MDQPVSYQLEDRVAVVTIDNPPVNALGHAVRVGLLAALDRFEKDGQADIALITGAGRMFVGGADIKEFGKPPQAPTLPEVFARLDQLEKPVVAALHGASLGGGFELPLACHFRLAMPGTRIGLPEVTLGLLPGAGGTQRVPRLVGVASAIDLMVSGAPILPERALELGLIDRIGEGDARAAGLAYAQELLTSGAGPRRVSEMPGPTPDAQAIAAKRAALEVSARGLAAPFSILDAVDAATRLPFEEGLKEERRLFMELMATPQRAGLIHAFFLERKLASLPELKGIEPRKVARIGVIGGGTMGSGIATAALLAGLPVVLVERDEAASVKARGLIAGNVDGAVKRGRLSQTDRDDMLSKRLSSVTDYAALADCDLVIEAVFESIDVKQDVFRKLDAVLKDGATLATNTSYLDVNAIAAVTRRPQDVIGLHFFSPAHVMKLLEIVVADATSPQVVVTAFALGKTLGKTSVRSGVCDGFIGNRILSHYRGTADRMVLAGASPYQVDRALTDFGFAMGPYSVADLAGLDIGYMTRQRKAATRDPRDVVPGWADDLYHLGRLGQKTGRGYYLYPQGARAGQPDPEVEELVETHRRAAGVTPRSFDDAEIVQRYMAAMVNEAARVVGEKIAARPLDVDGVLLFGYGFPRHRGGPMHWADAQGLRRLLADIREWSREDAYFWQPAPLLEELVGTGSSFASLNGE
jgi:3-hydroxyacyl-CoA dehydrogenase